MCTDSFEVTASPCVNVPQQVKFSAREQCLSPHTIDVPVYNDLVDLSYEVNKETSKEPSVVVLNSDLEGLSYPVPETSVHAVNSITFELCNNCPFVKGQVSGIPSSLLCDTGASVTTISERSYLTNSLIARKCLAVKHFNKPSGLSVVKTCRSKV